jgi:hypothetical protein
MRVRTCKIVHRDVLRNNRDPGIVEAGKDGIGVGEDAGDRRVVISNSGIIRCRII